MTLEEFKCKVDSCIAMVIDSQLTKDDAADAIIDCLTAVAEHEYWQGYYYYEQQWTNSFLKREE